MGTIQDKINAIDQLTNDEVEGRIAQLLQITGSVGIKIDMARYQSESSKLQTEMMQIENDVRKMVGAPLRMGSRKDVAAILFGKFGLEPTNNLSVSKAALAHHQHPFLPLYFRWGTVSRTLSLMKKVPNFVRDGRLTTVWDPTNDTSGRIYCHDANVQQLPKVMRYALIADPGRKFVLWDMKSVELRVLAALTQSAKLLSFIESGDPHRATAGLMLDKDPASLSDRQREFGKVLNYGPIYGMDNRGLASRLNISKDEAQGLLDKYFAQFPDIRDWMAETVAQARRDQKWTNPFGHTRHFTDWSPAAEEKTGRQVINTACQGTAASLLKRALLKTVTVTGVTLSATVHDSGLNQFPEEDLRYAAAVTHAATTIWNHVPFFVDSAVGNSWGECMDQLHGEQPDLEEEE